MAPWGWAVMSGQAAAFMSYVRFNDRHDDAQITQFRERLSAEVDDQRFRWSWRWGGPART